MRRAASLVLLVMTTGACSAWDDVRGRGDAPVGERHEEPRQVWFGPDQFPNLSAWCIGPNGVYTTTRDAAPVVLADDPNCDEGGILRDRRDDEP